MSGGADFRHHLMTSVSLGPPFDSLYSYARQMRLNNIDSRHYATINRDSLK